MVKINAAVAVVSKHCAPPHMAITHLHFAVDDALVFALAIDVMDLRYEALWSNQRAVWVQTK